MFTAREIFDIAIRLEHNGEQLYRQALDYVTDESLREMLIWLADQEVSHCNRFIEMKNSIKPGADELWAEQMGAAILRGAIEHRAFSLEEVDFKSIQDEAELMRVAIEFEEDGVTFYQIIRSFVTDPEPIKHIDEIIEEECKHVKFFQERQRTMEGLEAKILSPQ
jgi:rubrerythrin